MKKQRIQISNAVFFGVDAIVMIVVVISTLYPFIYMVMRSFSSGSTFGKFCCGHPNRQLLPIG